MPVKRAYHHSCTIIRTVKVTHSTLNMVSGKTTEGKTEIVTKPCGIPLFGKPHSTTGVCRHCAEGWSVKDNCFANDQERARAVASAALVGKLKT